MRTVSKIWILSLSVIAVAIAIGIVSLWLITQDRQTSTESVVPADIADAQLPREHLIPNVSYRGQYLGTILSNQESTAALTLLDYWNTIEVSNEELAIRLEPSSVEAFRNFGIHTVRDFFTEKNFYTELSPIPSSDHLKFFIANNVPVYVQQRLTPAGYEQLFSSRIYIGYSDEKREFTVHDNNFGNNFTISYDEFDSLSRTYQQMLIVTPSGYSLSNTPTLPSAQPSDYPERLAIMDDIGLRDIQIKLMLVNYHKKEAAVQMENRVSQTVQLLEEIITHEAFERLHPAARMSISYNLTGFYMSEAPDYQRAIEILETVTLPLIENYDFSEPFGEWDRKMDPLVYEAPYWSATPWARLGFLYHQLGNSDKSREAFNRSLEHVPGYPEAVTGLAELD